MNMESRVRRSSRLPNGPVLRKYVRPLVGDETFYTIQIPLSVGFVMGCRFSCTVCKVGNRHPVRSGPCTGLAGTYGGRYLAFVRHWSNSLIVSAQSCNPRCSAIHRPGNDLGGHDKRGDREIQPVIFSNISNRRLIHIDVLLGTPAAYFT